MERLTAIKTSVAALEHGSYVVKEGTAPSHVKTSGGEVSRANIIAAVVDKPGQTALLLDDGSARIEARSFDNNQLFENIMVGDVVLVIGRPRDYQGTRYLVAEIAKRLGSPKWLELRKAELGKTPPPQTPTPSQTTPLTLKSAAEKEAAAAAETVVSLGDKVLSLIKELDKGDGAPIEDIVAKNPDAEGTLTSLMAEGEIFEIKPGRVKVLE